MVAMINDCAFVGETLLRYLPSDVGWKHIKRGRGLWDKTIGLAYRILRVKADIYHAHYLLQDCYMALRLGKRPLVGHAHGSDLRSALRHPLWGKIVRYNLVKSDKILVSTPDILTTAKWFREDAEYLPNPVDMQVFYPKPLVEHGGRKRVLIASACNWAVKGTDIAIRALVKIKDEVEVSVIRHGIDFERTLALARSSGLHLNILPRVPHERMREYYWSADVVIDQFKIGSLGTVSLEAIACGRPAITYISSEYPEYRDFPLKDLKTESEIANSLLDADEKIWHKEYDYLKRSHSPGTVVERLLKIYRSLSYGEAENFSSNTDSK